MRKNDDGRIKIKKERDDEERLRGERNRRKNGEDGGWIESNGKDAARQTSVVSPLKERGVEQGNCSPARQTKVACCLED
jgi:hypothetical protein